MVTIKDVAKRAEVSPGTVSNALTGKRPVSEAARQRIQQAIEELGYQPNMLARSLVNRRSHTLAIVAWGVDYYGPSRTLVGIEQQAVELGYSLSLSLLHHPSKSDPNAALATLSAHRVDGIIWAVPEVGDNRSWIQRERLERLPPIIFLSMRPWPELSVVAVDNRAGAARATQHLIEQGRRTIGLIAGPLDGWEAQQRRAGWEETLQRAGLEASASLVVEGDWSAVSGERGLYQLLSQRPDLDAVFASNDQMALGALRVAHLLGRRVPQDLAVVGFDNIPESAFFWPPLTTIHQPLVDVGCIAVRELHRIIEAKVQNQDDIEPGSTVLEPELVIRESSVRD